MVKFITKTVCMAFIAALCVGNLFAQTERGNSQVADTQQETAPFILSDFRGGGDPVMIHNISSGAARKGTVTNPYGSQVGTTPGIQATEYIEGEFYGVNYASGGNNFGKINVNTGAWTLIKNAFVSDAASIAYNPVTGLTYCFPWTGDDSVGNIFGTIDLATGNVTTITTFPLDGNNSFYAAIDEDGTCYAMRNLTSSFGTINLATGAFTQIGTIPYSINFISDMSFDRETGDLYWLGRSSDFGGEGFSAYFKVNKATGALTQIVGPSAPGVNCFSVLNWYPNVVECPAITNLQAEKQGTDVKLTWTAAEGSPTGYKVFNGATELATVTVTEYLVKNLTNGSYTFGVEAIYDDECLPVKVTVPVTILTGDPVKNLNGACIGGTLTLTWDEPDGAVTHYDIYQNDVHFAKVTAPATTYTKNGLDDTHNYCVVAVYDADAQSVKVCKEIECVLPCDMVTEVETTVSCEMATITWTAVAGAKGYKVNGGAMITATEYTETGEFEDGETYTWMIVTVCVGGESDAVEVEGIADCVGINEYSINVAIFPNPANSTVNIQMTNFAKVEVYNTIGQLVETKTVPAFDVSTYNTGIYFFKVYDTNNNSVTTRVMVAK